MITHQNNSHIERWRKQLNYHFKNVVLFLTSEINEKEISSKVRFNFDPKNTIIISGPIEKVSTQISVTGFAHFLLSFGYDIQNYLTDIERLLNEINSSKSGGFILDNNVNVIKLHDLKISNERIFQIPWGVERSWLSGFEKKTFQKNNFTFISPRNHEEIYHIEDVLVLFQKFYEKNSRNNLYLLGDGTLNKKILEIVSKSKFAPNVIILGRVAENKYHDLLLDSDFYLSASEVDGSSISLLQAMSLGVIPVVSNIPANYQWVLNNETGFTFDNSNFQKTVDLVWEKLDLGMLPAISAEGRNHVLFGANWENNFLMLVNFLKMNFRTQ